MPARKKGRKNIGTYKHSSSKRTKIPTQQSEVYMSDEDKASVSYQQPLREAGSNPVLNWDRDVDIDSLEIQAHPLYIHEKVHPAGFVNSLLTEGRQDSLWDDFNGFPEGSAYEWYEHSGNWQNRIIRGDSSRIMASLIAKEGMAGKVQMIYFDPPYGISFKSNMQVSTGSRNVRESVESIPNDPTVIGSFRDTYKNGIHSYLDNIYKNALLARELLADTGSIFLQIGSDNVHRIAVLLEEVFGIENRVATIPFVKSGVATTKMLPLVNDYLLWYAKDREAAESKYRQVYEILSREEKIQHMSSYAAIELTDGTTRSLSSKEKKDISLLPEGVRFYRRMNPHSMHESNTGRSESYTWKGKEYPCPANKQWSVSEEGLDRLAELERLDVAEGSNLLCWKRYEDEVPGRRVTNLWSKLMSAKDMHYVVETAESVIERCLLMSTDPGDLILDITCGSGTTAFVAERWGRRWITTDTSGVAVSLARQRLATGVFDYYILQDSMEGAKKEGELSGQKIDMSTHNFNNDVAKGFVYHRVPTVNASILAYDIDAEPTYLVNKPYKRSNTIRVSSPFTVESESPYRVIPPEENIGQGEEAKMSMDHISTIKSALEKTGISTQKFAEDQKLRFTEVADWVQSAGTGRSKGSNTTSPITHTARATVAGEKSREYEVRDATRMLGMEEMEGMKAAIAIAPDDMTVSTSFIDKAAESAARIVGKEGLLVVIGFSFEATARTTDLDRRGKLIIVKAQANRDLQIGNLKDGKSDHAFVMVGEPDVSVEAVGEELIIVEVLGYDTYNPANGNVEPGGAKDIACWMIDSNYDGKSFFAKHIHFPHQKQAEDKQIKRLKKVLGRNLNQQAWDAMVSHKSMPFKRPKTGRIAVRIVTTTHTEMTTVIDCPTTK